MSEKFPDFCFFPLKNLCVDLIKQEWTIVDSNH